VIGTRRHLTGSQQSVTLHLPTPRNRLLIALDSPRAPCYLELNSGALLKYLVHIDVGLDKVSFDLHLLDSNHVPIPGKTNLTKFMSKANVLTRYTKDGMRSGSAS
jgi:hypothetical protein